jgi:hypothetical protein
MSVIARVKLPVTHYQDRRSCRRRHRHHRILFSHFYKDAILVKLDPHYT